MNLRETRSGAVTVLTLSGRLDGVSAPTVEAHASQLVAGGVKRLVVDCSELSYISSAGLRVFIATAKQMQSLGGRCGFAALSPAARQIFQLSGLLELLEVHDTLADACA